MCSRHQNSEGADSAQALANAIALVENAGYTILAEHEGVHRAIVPSCIACELPALPGSVYCAAHEDEPPVRHPALLDREPWSGGIAADE